MRLQQVFLTAFLAASTLLVAGCPAKDASSGSDAGPARDASPARDSGSATDGSSSADGDASQEPACWMHTVAQPNENLLLWSARPLGTDGQMEWTAAIVSPARLDGDTALQPLGGSDRGYVSLRTGRNGAVVSVKPVATPPPVGGPWRVLADGRGVVSTVRASVDLGSGAIPGSESFHSVVAAVRYQVGCSTVIWNSLIFGSMKQKAPFTRSQVMSDGRIAISAWAEPDAPLFVRRTDGTMLRVAEEAAVVSTVLPDGKIAHTWVLPIDKWPAAKGGWAGRSQQYPEHRDFYWTGVFVVPSEDGGAIGTVNGRLVRFPPDGSTRPFSADADGSYDPNQPWKPLVWEPGEQTLLVWRLDENAVPPTISATRFDRDGHVVRTGLAKGEAVGGGCLGASTVYPIVGPSGDIIVTLDNTGSRFNFGNGVGLGGGGQCGDSYSSQKYVGLAKFDHEGRLTEASNIPSWLWLRALRMDSHGGTYFVGQANSNMSQVAPGKAYSAGCGPLPEGPTVFMMHFRSDQWPDLPVLP